MFSIGSARWPGISKLIEECGEVTQVCGKLVATRGQPEHWDGTDLEDRLEDELGDLQAAIEFVIEHCELSGDRVFARRHEKLELFKKWHVTNFQEEAK